ncbi:hypothetical protein LCGC14_2147830 [marine sediment metagenome]|uniref:Uncharacterized protein n=1 Tax=marine sediment metagenome TaxID=412755 RepID=A0A0F9EIL9_9ZZZZ
MAQTEPKIEGRSLEEYRTSAVTLLLSIHHNTEWQEAIEILDLAKGDIDKAIQIAEQGDAEDQS